MIALALLVRVVHVASVAPTPLFSYHRIFVESDMYIFDRWAHQIAAGDVLGREPFHFVAQWQLAQAPAEQWARWYGEPLVFHKAPFYAYLLALLIRLFGDAMLPVALLQVLASIPALVLLQRVTERLFGSNAGLIAAAILAVYGPAIHFDAAMLRGPWIVLSTLLVTWRLLEVQRLPGTRSAVLLGVAVGLSLLVNEGCGPAAVLAPAVFGLWFPELRRWAILTSGYLLGTLLALAPVVVRNYLVGAPLFRWAVLGSTAYALCNTAGTSPYFFELHPSLYLPVLAASGGRLIPTVIGCLRSFDGPRAILSFYLERLGGLLVPFENPDNVNIYYAALKSPLLAALPGWSLLFPLAAVGLVLARRRIADLAALAPATLTLGASILLTLPMSRYRATLAVYLIPFAALALIRGAEWARQRRFGRLGIAAAGVLGIQILAAAFQARVVFAGGPAGAYLYRRAEFWLGATFYEQQGRLNEAAGEAFALARLNPDAPVQAAALLSAGRLEARLDHASVAQDALRRAAARSDDPLVLIEIGDSQARLVSDRAGARETYAKASRNAAGDVQATIEERLRSLGGGDGG